MPVRRIRILLLASLAALVLPAGFAHAQETGGAEAGGPTPATTGGVSAASDGGFYLAARSDALLRRTLHFRGTLPSSEAGRTVTIERFDPKAAAWVPAASAVVDANGGYLARWRTNRSGRLRMRATLASSAAHAASASPEIAVTVYKPAMATWYGPGFYGRRTACGKRMTRTLLGVAHKTLPCGTPVAVFYRGRSITVPVVDRGPFRRGTSWDLTAATAQALGFTFTDTVGAVPLRP